jgi:hypothetical protein
MAIVSYTLQIFIESIFYNTLGINCTQNCTQTSQ